MVGKKSTENASEARSGPNPTAASPDSTYFYGSHFPLLEQIVNGNLKKNQEYNNTIVSLMKETTFCVWGICSYTIAESDDVPVDFFLRFLDGFYGTL